MAEIKSGGLTARIPRDVRVRAEKAGVHEVDWYAGRLEQTDRSLIAHASGSSGDAEQRRAVKRFREQRGEHRSSAIVRFAAMWARAVRRVPRRVG